MASGSVGAHCRWLTLPRTVIRVTLIWYVGILVTIALIATIWVRDNPTPTGWDDALYLNQVIQDGTAFREHGPAGLLTSLLLQDPARPPAYRLLASPLAIGGVVDAAPYRLFSLSIFAVAIGVLGRVVARATSFELGLLFAALAAATPSITRPNADYGTEFALYLALAGTVWVLERMVLDRGPSLKAELGLALAVALGCCAKVSFTSLLVPLVAISLFVALRAAEGRTAAAVRRGVLLGILLASPVWVANGRAFLSYAQYSAGYQRHDLGGAWIHSVLLEGIGLPIAALLGLLLTLTITARLRDGALLHGRADRLALICAAGGVPLIAIQAFGSSNHNLRLIGPALLLTMVAIVLAFGADRRSAPQQALAGLAAAVLLTAQIPAALKPAFELVDGWDWSALRRIMVAEGRATPRIAHLGNGNQYSPPVIEYAWRRNHGVASDTWLWRYEQGPFDLGAVSPHLASFDAVLVARNYKGRVADNQPEDNRHNDTLYAHLLGRPEFQPPLELVMGQREPVMIAVFLRAAR